MLCSKIRCDGYCRKFFETDLTKRRTVDDQDPAIFFKKYLPRQILGKKNLTKSRCWDNEISLGLFLDANVKAALLSDHCNKPKHMI